MESLTTILDVSKATSSIALGLDALVKEIAFRGYFRKQDKWNRKELAKGQK